MIANVIERQFKRANDWPFGAAMSFVLMYLTFIAIAIQACAVAPKRRRPSDGRAKKGACLGRVLRRAALPALPPVPSNISAAGRCRPGWRPWRSSSTRR
jgi:hypothetical protein